MSRPHLVAKFGFRLIQYSHMVVSLAAKPLTNTLFLESKYDCGYGVHSIIPNIIIKLSRIINHNHICIDKYQIYAFFS